MDSESLEHTTAGVEREVEAGGEGKAGYTSERRSTAMRTAPTATLKANTKAVVDLTRDDGQEAERYGSARGPSGVPPQAEAVASGGDAEDEKDSAARSQLGRTVSGDLKAVYERSSRVQQVEVAREMRFGLRLIVTTLSDRILDGERESEGLQRDVLLAVDPFFTGIENVRLRAARAIHDTIKGLDWQLDAAGDDGSILPAEEQPANVALGQIIAGIREMDHQLNGILQEDGTEEVKLESEEGNMVSNADDDREAVVADRGAITATTQQTGPVGSSLGALQATPQRRGGPRIRWTTAEDLILVQAYRANRGSPLTAIVADHNRRMRIDRQSVGAVVHRDRARSAVEARRKHLRRAFPDI